MAKVDLDVDYLGKRYALSANEFVGSTVDPTGFIHLESFTVEHGVPVWRYAIADALLEQKIFMARGANTSYLRLEVLRASAPLRLALKPLVTYRDYHSQSAARILQVGPGRDRCTVEAFEGARPYRIGHQHRRLHAGGYLVLEFPAPRRVRAGPGFARRSVGAGAVQRRIERRPSLIFTATAETAAPAPGDDVLAAVVDHSQRLIATLPKTAPPWVQRLATASDQFIVQRDGKSAAKPAAASVIAGYPWFTTGAAIP